MRAGQEQGQRGDEGGLTKQYPGLRSTVANLVRQGPGLHGDQAEEVPAQGVREQSKALHVGADLHGQDIRGMAEDQGDAAEVTNQVPSGGGRVIRTMLNFLTSDSVVRPRDIDVGDKRDSLSRKNLTKSLPVKRKESEVESEGCVEPDRKRKNTPLRGKRNTRSEIKDKIKNVNRITNHFQLYSSAATGNDRLHVHKGDGDLDGGGDEAVPGALAKNNSVLASGALGGKTEQLVRNSVVGQPLAADAKLPNSGQFYRQSLGKLYSGEIRKK